MIHESYVLTGDERDVQELLRPELSEDDLLRLVLQSFLVSMALLGAVQDRLFQPFWVHGREQSKEEFLLGLSVTSLSPGIRAAAKELRDFLDLLPHVGDGELRPLRDLHRGDLEVPEHVLLTSKDLVQESDRTVLFLWEEDVLKIKIDIINFKG